MNQTTVPDTLSAVTEFASTLKPAAREAVLTHSKAFLDARAIYATSELSMGEHLYALRQTLEPLAKWKVYINLLPNMSQASAYRYIWRWENARKVLPPATLKVAAREGFKLISFRKGEEFAPGYGEAFKRVTRRMGKPPSNDEGKAKVFLTEVLKEKKKAKRGNGKKVTEAALAKRVVHAFKLALAQLPPTRHQPFVQKVMSEVEIVQARAA